MRTIPNYLSVDYPKLVINVQALWETGVKKQRKEREAGILSFTFKYAQIFRCVSAGTHISKRVRCRNLLVVGYTILFESFAVTISTTTGSPMTVQNLRLFDVVKACQKAWWM